MFGGKKVHQSQGDFLGGGVGTFLVAKINTEFAENRVTK